MLTLDRAGAIFDDIRRRSTADEVEVLFYGGRNALTRFANNIIHQNVSEEHHGLSVRSVFGRKTARASTNRLDGESLRRVVETSEQLARVQQPDEDLLPMPGASEAAGSSGPVAPPSRHFERTAALTPEDRAAVVGNMVGVARRHALTAAGIFSSSETVESLFNSRGLAQWHRQTSSEISITMLAADSSGWQKANSPDAGALDAPALAESAARKAVESAHPREIPPGRYTVVLEPAAVLDIVGFMFYDFGGLSILDQRSFLNNRVGQQIFGDNISIWDDADHPLQSGPPFDGEGMRRQRIQLVENGVVRRLVHARATAARLLRSDYKDSVGPVAPTGHGFPLPNEMGEAPVNIVFAPVASPQSVGEMVASTERGILVTRLWYIREVDPYEKLMTGMTRDGTFFIQKGKVAHGLRNFRFNESLLHMLSNVEAMSLPVRASGEESFDMVAPAMKVRDFNFTDVTKF